MPTTTRFVPRFANRTLEPVVRRLSASAPLSAEEQAFVRMLSDRRERHAVGDELVAEGQSERRARFIVSGWASRQRVLPDGRRQIFAFLLPGDGLNLGARPAPPALTSVVATTPLETVDAEPLVEAARSGRAPGLLRAFAAADRLDQAKLLDHVVRLGRRTAYERVAHFLLELQDRMETVGLGDSQRFPLPLTQEVLADALGLSIVHVNRTLQQLRRERLIELRSGVAILLQRDILAAIADWKRPTV